MEEFGRLITAAFGLDTSWHSRAACRDYPVSKRVDGKTPWHVEKDFEERGVKGMELIKIALMVCHSCPAQYDCARFAIEGEVRGGTYAMNIGDLRWLQDKAIKHGIDKRSVIDVAEMDNVPVQTLVVQIRASVRASDRRSA